VPSPSAPLLVLATEASGDLTRLLGVLVALIVATKLLGELAQRVGQPAVLGELVAGVILGRSLLGWLDPADPVIHFVSELGVLILLFQIGLHTDLKALLKVGSVAGTVGAVGVVLPFAFGYGVAMAFGLTMMQALVCGAALTATSIGISARVLSDLGELQSPGGQVVLGAAVLDDVIGLVILAVVSAVAAGGSVGAWEVTRIAGIAIGFVVLALALGPMVVEPLFKRVGRLRASGALGLIGLAFALTMALVAEVAGSAPIIGAFAAGVLLHTCTGQKHEIEASATALGHFFVPVFFAAVGAAVDVRAFADPRILALGGALIAVGIAGKVVAGYAPWWFTGRKLMVGIAMVPRGEVGLIFANMGIATAVLDQALFSAIALMVMVTTLVAPPALQWAVGRARTPGGDAPGGLDDLVSGTGLRARAPTDPRGYAD
jgi:Kef-type K+ transport system membrane component KefB